MQKKQGISLIVLVITIIVMIILSGAIILTLNNSGIIDKANETVDKTNLNEIRSMASLAWAEAYMDGERDQVDLEKAVTDAFTQNKITEKDYEGYTLVVTTSGVSLEKIEYVDFELDDTNWSKIGYNPVEDGDGDPRWQSDVKELIIPSTFYDEQDGVWYKVTSVNIFSTDLKKIVIPNGVASVIIESNWSLESVNIPEGVTKILANSFAESFALKEIVIPSGVTEIGEFAFLAAESMEKMTIPHTVTKIEAYGLNCLNLSVINYTGTKEQWNAINLADDWNLEMPQCTVHCTNGDIIIEAHPNHHE